MYHPSSINEALIIFFYLFLFIYLFIFFFFPNFAVTSHYFMAPLVLPVSDSAHGFQSQGTPIITCALLSLEHNDPQSQL